MNKGYIAIIAGSVIFMLAALGIIIHSRTLLDPKQNNSFAGTESFENKNTPQTGTTTIAVTNNQFGRFRIYELTFLYPQIHDAIWIDDGQWSYTYRFPYDPALDSNVDANGEYIYTNSAPSYFSLHISSIPPNETVEQYIKRTYPDLDMSGAMVSTKHFRTYIFKDSGGGDAPGGHLALFRSGTICPDHSIPESCYALMYEMEDADFYSDIEFLQIVQSATSSTVI